MLCNNINETACDNMKHNEVVEVKREMNVMNLNEMTGHNMQCKDVK